MEEVIKSVMNTSLEELKAKEDEIYRLWKQARLFVEMKEIFIAGEKYNKKEYIFHAGTTEINGKIFTNGGRVLNSTVSLPSMKASRDRAIELLNQVVWENKYFRKDIGWRVIK